MQLETVSEEFKHLARTEYILDKQLSNVRERLKPLRCWHGEEVLWIFMNYHTNSIKLFRLGCSYGMWRTVDGMLSSKTAMKKVLHCRFPLMFVCKSIYNHVNALIKECTLQYLIASMGVGKFVMSEASPYAKSLLFAKRNGFIRTHLFERRLHVKAADTVYTSRVEYLDTGGLALHIDLYMNNYFIPRLGAATFSEFSCEYMFRDTMVSERKVVQVGRPRYITPHNDLEICHTDMCRLKEGFERILLHKDYTMLLGIGIDLLSSSKYSDADSLVHRVTSYV